MNPFDDVKLEPSKADMTWPNVAFVGPHPAEMPAYTDGSGISHPAKQMNIFGWKSYFPDGNKYGDFLWLDTADIVEPKLEYYRDKLHRQADQTYQKICDRLSGPSDKP